MQRILVATRSHHKLAELRQLLHLPEVELVTLDDLGIPGDPVEDGATFADNALIKARWGSARSSLPTLADDSGIEVDALDGGPGVRTKRYAGETASDAENNAKLLAELATLGAGAPAGRGARYVCVLAFIEPGRPTSRSSPRAPSSAASPRRRGAPGASAMTPSSSPTSSRPAGGRWAR